VATAKSDLAAMQGNVGKSFGVTSALDVTDQGQTPTGYAALNPSCVSASYAVRPAAFTRSSADRLNLR
jgi:hypothetical protein